MGTPIECPLCDNDHRRGSAECPAQRVGKVVAEKFRLEGLMGVGGMGAVYKATHATLGTRVAIKMIHARFAANEAVARRFDQEAQRVAALRHPGIVQVTDLGRDADGSSYLEMELLDGTPVDKLLEKGPLPIARAGDIVIQALEALEYAHNKGIIHRDLKPENLFLVGSQVKILDFGIAKALEEAEGPSMTKTGSVMGTPLYMSPEQLTDAKRVDARTDIYAMGATLYELLTAKHTVTGSTYPELMSKILTGDVSRTPRERRPELTESLDGVVARALAHKPEERFESAVAMRNALRTAIEGYDDAAKIADEAPDSQPERSSESKPERGPDTDPRLARTRAAEELGARPAAPTVANERSSSSKAMRIALPAAVLAIGAGAMIFMGGAGDEESVELVEDKETPKPLPAADAALPVPVPVPDGMQRIAGASFRMGSTADEIETAFQLCRSLVGDDCPRALFEREQPLRELRVSSFFLDTTEVTAADFADALVGAETRIAGREIFIGDMLIASLAEPGSPLELDQGSVAVVEGRSRRPMAQVSWEGANWFCERLGKRLPTEAEWELASRGPGRRIYPWGDQEKLGCEAVVHARGASQACAAQGDHTADVASTRLDVTPEGIHDLAGNVAEWVADEFRDRYDTDCSEDCVVSAPPGAKVQRTVRGGYFDATSESLRGAGRSRLAHDSVWANGGLRCAKDSS